MQLGDCVIFLFFHKDTPLGRLFKISDTLARDMVHAKRDEISEKPITREVNPWIRGASIKLKNGYAPLFAEF